MGLKDANLPPANLYAQYYNPPVPQNSDLAYNSNTPYVGWVMNCLMGVGQHGDARTESARH